jgi:hypothetical protein
MVSRCPPKLLTHSPFLASQTHTLRSLPALARYLPSSLRARVSTSSLCPGVSVVALSLPLPPPGRSLWKVASLVPLRRSHLMIEPSFPEVKRKRASLQVTADVTENLCPRVRSVGGGREKSNCCGDEVSAIRGLQLKKALTESATNKCSFPACSSTSCLRRAEISSLSISAASTSPSAYCAEKPE